MQFPIVFFTFFLISQVAAEPEPGGGLKFGHHPELYGTGDKYDEPTTTTPKPTTRQAPAPQQQQVPRQEPGPSPRREQAQRQRVSVDLTFAVNNAYATCRMTCQ